MDWIAGGTSLLARVPSVIVREEFNVLVNPAHAGRAGARAQKLRRWLYCTTRGWRPAPRSEAS